MALLNDPLARHDAAELGRGGDDGMVRASCMLKGGRGVVRVAWASRRFRSSYPAQATMCRDLFCPLTDVPKDRTRGLHVALRRWDDGGIRQREEESAGSPFGPQTLFTFSEWKIGGAEDSASSRPRGKQASWSDADHAGFGEEALRFVRRGAPVTPCVEYEDGEGNAWGGALGSKGWNEVHALLFAANVSCHPGSCRWLLWMIASICNPDFHHAQKAVLYGSTCDSALILTAKIPTAMDRESFEAASHDPQRAPRRCHGDDNPRLPVSPVPCIPCARCKYSRVQTDDDTKHSTANTAPRERRSKRATLSGGVASAAIFHSPALVSPPLIDASHPVKLDLEAQLRCLASAATDRHSPPSLARA
ncbi:hypothetical protein V501_03409 [Pseudogymnoascus sp. VKM F-4519 (FW-2642)]|nr:hypothetical protein V501_03409 [Pseudogymnoascus sp. VKM F-4519 (FW-2642)]